jgi:hypothetical protein
VWPQYPYQSIATPLLSWLFLGSTVHPSDYGGGFIIVAGLVLCIGAKWREHSLGAGLTPHEGAARKLAGTPPDGSTDGASADGKGLPGTSASGHADDGSALESQSSHGTHGAAGAVALPAILSLTRPTGTGARAYATLGDEEDGASPTAAAAESWRAGARLSAAAAGGVGSQLEQGSAWHGEAGEPQVEFGLGGNAAMEAGDETGGKVSWDNDTTTLPSAVRGHAYTRRGGHGGAGSGVADGGLMNAGAGGSSTRNSPGVSWDS